MVTLHYVGRFANCLFIYAFGRMIAEKNGLRLETPWQGEIKNQFGDVHGEIIHIKPCPDGKVNKGVQPIILNDDSSIECLNDNYQNRAVYVNGYMQNHLYYDKNKQQIKSWIELPPIESGHENDIALHIRIDDYKNTKGMSIISPKWYRSILDMPENKGKKVYAVVDKVKSSWEFDYMTNFDGGGFKIVSDTAKHDFHFLRSFGTLIISNSSFAWWAAYLGEAKKIFTFDRWMIGSPKARLAQAEGMTPVPGKYIWEN
jgi:hypothetical protein